MTTVVLGVDLGTNVCSVIAMDGGGRVLVRRRLKRPAVVDFCAAVAGLRGRWKRAAVRIVWAGGWRRKDTRSG